MLTLVKSTYVKRSSIKFLNLRGITIFSKDLQP